MGTSGKFLCKWTVADLPEDIFLIILDSLDAWDVACCQKVCRTWRQAFYKDDYLKRVLKGYPKARELRNLTESDRNNTHIDLGSLFNRVASRYHGLVHGRPGKVERYKLAVADQRGHWVPIGQWTYHESQPGGRLYFENAATHLSKLGNKPYLFRASLWSYDDGLLVAAFLLDEEDADDRDSSHILSIVDIQSGQYYPVPFSITNKIIRNITFRCRALVIEWAEYQPYHDLNDAEKVHRHFATCYHILSSSNGDGTVTRKVEFRNEWKMHFLGLPLNLRDRFFSTHNGTHYAIYIWQPNRSMYTGDEDMPIEALFVWDISIHCAYRPSLDPCGASVPDENRRPHVISRFTFNDLEFLGIRQHSNISLMSMHLDSEARTLNVKENFSVSGQGYYDPADRPMRAASTSFPFLGQGCAWRREWHEALPPYRGHCSMESTEVEEPEKWFTNVMDVVDEEADVRLSLIETCFTGVAVQNRLVVRVKALDEWASMDDGIAKEVGVMGRIAGDERWIVGQNGSMELVVVKF